MENLNQTFAKAIFGKRRQKEIQATFRDGSTAVYTEAVLKLLATDPDTVEIIDLETGELLYNN